jgi:hypothetical protein
VWPAAPTIRDAAAARTPLLVNCLLNFCNHGRPDVLGCGGARLPVYVGIHGFLALVKTMTRQGTTMDRATATSATLVTHVLGSSGSGAACAGHTSPLRRRSAMNSCWACWGVVLIVSPYSCAISSAMVARGTRPLRAARLARFVARAPCRWLQGHAYLGARVRPTRLHRRTRCRRNGRNHRHRMDRRHVQLRHRL